MVAVRFGRGGQVVEWPENAAGTFAIKLEFGGQFVALAPSWTPSGYGADRHYSFDVNLNTQELEALFAEEPASVSLLAEVSVTSGAQIFSSQTLRVIVTNDVIRGDEGDPTETIEYKATQAEALEGASNEKWMTPLRTKEAVGAFPPSPHGHVIEDVADLAHELAGKAAAEHMHLIEEVAWLPEQIADVFSALSSLQVALDGKADASHTHPANQISDSTGSGRTLLTSNLVGARAHLGFFPSFANRASFPATGDVDRVYTALDTLKIYVWVPSLSTYVEVSPQVKADWNAASGDAQILNKPALNFVPAEHFPVDISWVDVLNGPESDGIIPRYDSVNGFVPVKLGSAAYADTADFAAANLVGSPVEYVIACSNETTALTVGAARVTFRAPVAFRLASVSASVSVAPTGSTLVVDINNGANSVLSTKLSIDATEKTSATAATAAVINTSFHDFTQDAEITIDIDQIGSTVAGAGLKVILRGTRL